MNDPARPTEVLRWRPLSLLLFAGGAALLVGAVTVRSPVPIFLALPLLLAPPAAAWGGPRGSPHVTLVRRAEGTGMEVRVVGSVVPTDRVDARDLDVAFDRPPGLAETLPAEVETAHDAWRFALHWRAPEPTIVVLPPPRIVWRDSSGLVERATSFDADPLVVERYPPELVRIGAVRLRRTMALPGETPSPRVGATGEFHGLRDAGPTDPPRVINWRASARVGRLVANEFDLDRTGDVLLLLDARASTLGPTVDERLLSISRAAAAGIAESFLHEKARVGIGVFGEFLDTVPLSTGRAHRWRVRDHLLSARLGPANVPSERGAVSVSRYFPPGVTTILFSPLIDESAGELVLHLCRRGYPVIVLSPSPVPILAEESVLTPEDEALVGRIVALGRRARVARTWRDAPTVDWDDYWSLAHLVELLRRPADRRVG
ncbi:MAG: DUF58 domain-containing protein [Thermoplasmata archaeon]